VLAQINNLEKRKDTAIQEIKVGEMQISKKQLLLKELLLMGKEHYYKKEYEKALEWIDKALEIDPKLALACNNKGLALDSLGKSNEAIEYYDKALEIDPKLALAWNNKGLALNKLENYQEAIEYYDKALEINPKLALAWNNKGYALTRKQYYSRLSALLKAGIVKRVKGKYSLTAFGVIVYHAQGIIGKAVDEYWKLKTIDLLDLEMTTCYKNRSIRSLTN